MKLTDRGRTVAAAMAAAAHARPESKAAIALAALLLVGLHPLTYFSLAASFDGLLHLYRFIELDHLIAEGVWFPRWAPDFVFGFGYPIFNYYAPLSYYVSLPLHWAGLSFASSATVFFVGCTFMAALGMCALARSLLDNNWHAGIAAAIVYAYAPTHLYDNLYRSAWATVLAYALVPWVFWALARWYQSGHGRYLNALGAGIAALMLSHNVTALLVLPVTGIASLAFYPLVMTSGGVPLARVRARRFVVAWLAILAGLALSAFFWVPALAETQFVQTWRLTIPPDFDFHTHFLSPAEWIAWPAPAEIGRINPDLVNTLGPVHALLAAAGLLGILAMSRLGLSNVVPIAFFGLVLAGALFMTVPLSAPIWETSTLLASLQFPHRFLELAALAIAILAGAAIAPLPARLRSGTNLVVCAALVVSTIPFLYPRPQPPIDPNPTLADMLAHEHTTGALGTTASGEYFPVAVQFIPRNSAFEDAIAAGANPQRFESRSLPPGARVVAQRAAPLSYAVQIETPQTFTATFRIFYFPGWQGYVDGQPVPTMPNQGQGLSTFAVPAGAHQIAMIFGSTPTRDVATMISAGACVIVLLWLAVQWRRRTARRAATDSAQCRATAAAPISPYAWLGLALIVFKVGIADRVDTPLRTTFDGVHVPTVQYARQIRLGESMTWLGYDLPQANVKPGEPLVLTLYWQTDQNVGTVYSSFAHVVDERANLYAQQDNLHPGGAPTTTWHAREYDVDRHSITIPAGTPPGDYWVEAGLYDPRNGARLQRDRAGPGEPLDRLLIGPIQIQKSEQPASISALQVNQPHAAVWAGGLRLLGISLERDRLPVDDFLRVALFWQADTAPLPALSMSLRLVDAQGRMVAMQHSQPSNDRYPTALWSAAERVRDNRALWVSGTLPNGSYHLQLNVDLDDKWLDLGAISK